MAQKKVPPAVDGVPSGVTGRADSPEADADGRFVFCRRVADRTLKGC